MNKKLHVVSLGCTKNLVDTEVMLGRLKNFEMTDSPDEADVIIVNTCGFIDAAKEESIQTVLNLHEARKEDSVLVMAGCLSERYKQELQKEMPEVDIFTGVGDYDKIDELIAKRKSHFTPHVFLADENHERIVTGSTSHAYVKLAEGCNQTCSFCAIPSFKGKLHSRTLESVVKEVKRLVNQGFYDFSFISQDSSSYLRDLGKNDGLIDLIKAIEEIDGVKSARILYLYPSTTSMELIETIAVSKIFQNYFDMPIQHINHRVLKAMKRGIGSDKIKILLNAMKAVPNSFVRTSVIVGFPTETQEEFEDLCNYIEEFAFDRVNIFEYSDEEGTSAYELHPKIDEETIHKRAEKLGEIVEETTKNSLNKMVGKTLEMIVEGPSEEHEYLLAARPLLWAPEIDGTVLINDSEVEGVEFGKTYQVLVTESAGNQLIGKIINAS
ncbi:30S ribosomal protein S12 methylthiotransferase RimO [Hydrogenimonas thermophila]|uniref:Ribosomal protein uS12 methylthiotransferase RimO n=1 Tax=Hydrogenimonas thermophila TaxID=223786 RepID=A0A1I5P9H9_9BACT|nr:30S ribosomal protein S12 methylthiotransferase RimO [Hydrogenimonas thermophila]WOE69642.1 30S ribosomal protein S12 methylthiotransferase RimO [Hydrogenimonas thermophila]WOE72156.1 30S ribosomal protein S12 methylthiotransferase RimO [Hydrogenimonas thermophila]SFP30440.1 SSU ribosomal protein S12P methylthiotransferase [Hydrogenimonas thermophila]